MPSRATPKRDSQDRLFGRCRVCHEEIEVDARKCIHCNSFQNWRRFLNLGNTTLALIVALISVVSLAVPPLMKAIELDKEQIEIYVVSDKIGNLEVVAYNNGTAIGVIKKHVQFSVTFLNGNTQEEELFVNTGVGKTSDARILKPQDAYSYYISGIKKLEGANQCKLIFHVINPVSKETRFIDVAFACA